jgi:hypothetical protein
MSWTVQQQNWVFAALHRNRFIDILRGGIRIEFWSHVWRGGCVACSAIRNLSTNSAFGLGRRKILLKDFEFAGRRTFRLRGPFLTIFSDAPCNTSAIRIPLPSCSSEHCQNRRALLWKFQNHFRYARVVAKNASLFPSVCLSLRLSSCTSADPTVRNSAKLEIWECHENMSRNPRIWLLKSGRSIGHFALKAKYVLLLPTILNRHINLFDLNGIKPRRCKSCGNAPQCYVKRTLLILFLIKLFNCFSAVMSLVSPAVSISLAFRKVNGPSACTYAYYLQF